MKREQLSAEDAHGYAVFLDKDGNVISHGPKLTQERVEEIQEAVADGEVLGVADGTLYAPDTD